jgi:hypothetical protein
VLEVWSVPPGTTGAVKLDSIAVPALAPGAHADLSGAVAAAEAAAPEASAARYLLLDPANLVQEIDENGNLTAIAGTGSGPIVPPTGQFRILLPLVQR